MRKQSHPGRRRRAVRRPPDHSESEPTPYWLDRRENRGRTDFGRGPSAEEAALENLMRDWYGPQLADAEIAARRRPPARAAEIIDDVIEIIGIAYDMHLHTLQQRWKEIVGPAVAAQTMPVRIDDNLVLWIEVGNPTWLYNLQTFMKKQLYETVRSRTGMRLADIRFVPGGRRRPSARG